MKIVTDYPGGNAIIHEIKDNEVLLEQDLTGTSKWWFYWNFKVIDAPVGKVRFTFLNDEVVSPFGPATSTDGVNWTWHTDGFVDHTHFDFEFTGEKERYFSFSLPYQVSHFELFFDKIKVYPTVSRSVLAVSEGGREIPIVNFGNGKKDIFFVARHHCCESVASYVVEGAVYEVLTNQTELFENYRFHVIPFVDIDGVELGEQGKDRPPHDHNRDYIEKPIYNYTKAIYEYIKDKEIDFYLDCHCPLKWGRRQDEPSFYCRPLDNKPESQKFLEYITEISTLPDSAIKFKGDVRQSSSVQSSNGYFSDVKKAKISFTVETPYSGNLEQGYTVENLHQWGANLLKAIEKTLVNGEN